MLSSQLKKQHRWQKHIGILARQRQANSNMNILASSRRCKEDQHTNAQLTLLPHGCHWLSAAQIYVNISMRASRRYASRLREGPQQATPWTQCVSMWSSMKRPNTLVALIWMRPQILKNLGSSSLKMLHQALTPLFFVLAGNAGHFSVTQGRNCGCTETSQHLTKCGASSLFLRSAHSLSCVLVKKKVSILRTGMVKFTWRPMPGT